jgi:type 1 fimbriae regulatory protein FimB/type 1 fimbriae regulatory protein FimE
MSNIVPLEVDRHAAPNTINGKVPPRRRKNSEVRRREYLTPDEGDKLMDVAGKLGLHGHRDRTLILIAFRHALRVSELVALRWDQVHLKQGILHVNRSKNGTPSSHPLRGPEIRALRRLKRDYPGDPLCLRN